MADLTRLLSPVVPFRREETTTGLLMFVVSFLAMTAYNAVKPLTQSAFIRDLGADNLPYVLLATGLLIGVIMSGYAWLVSRLPRRWSLPIVQALMAALLLVFWWLFRTGQPWVSVAFYLYGYGVLGVLLLSQFWTLADLLYDARQAKAALRVHRRRGAAWRAGRQRHRGQCPGHRLHQPAAAERGAPGRVCGGGRVGHRTRAAGRTHRRCRATGRRARPGGAAPASIAATCR